MALRAYRLLAGKLVDARPGLAAPIATAAATGDEAVLDAMERLILIDQVRREQGPADPEARAKAAFERMWPTRDEGR